MEVMQKEILLKLENVRVTFGGVTALDDVSIAVDEGEMIALMGPNGAGKSTLLKTLFGLVPIERGGVVWREKKIVAIPHEMVLRGVTFVPQGRQVFKSLTVYENLELGGYALPNKKDVKMNIEEALNFFPALKEKLEVNAGLLSGGQQQMLTIARGLVSDPKVLLLDEPSLGLSPKIVTEVFAKIKEINALRKVAVVIVEHSIASVLAITDRAYVLSQGKVVLDQTTRELQSSNALQNVFLSNA